MEIMEMCACGRPATTDIQCGWDPAANNGAGGGVHAPLCEECYSQTDEAAYHREVYAAIVQDVYRGLYTRTNVNGHVRWVGPGGRFFDDEIYWKVLTDPYGVQS